VWGCRDIHCTFRRSISQQNENMFHCRHFEIRTAFRTDIVPVRNSKSLTDLVFARRDDVTDPKIDVMPHGTMCSCRSHRRSFGLKVRFRVRILRSGKALLLNDHHDLLNTNTACADEITTKIPSFAFNLQDIDQKSPGTSHSKLHGSEDDFHEFICGPTSSQTHERLFRHRHRRDV
jgi:hypothetical protein